MCAGKAVPKAPPCRERLEGLQEFPRRGDHDLENLGPIIAVMRCCKKGRIKHKQHGKTVCMYARKIGVKQTPSGNKHDLDRADRPSRRFLCPKR